MAAAIGIKMPIKEPKGSMVIDIGGGTTDVAVISLGGIVKAKSMKIAGDRFNSDISLYLRDEFKILIGEKTAEQIKVAVGSVLEEEPKEIVVRGRDIVTGLPREVVVTDSDVREAIAVSVTNMIDGIKEILETTPPEVLSDVMQRGITLTGGGALLRGLAPLLETILSIPVRVSSDPLTAVVRGTGVILDDIETYKDVLMREDNELPPR